MTYVKKYPIANEDVLEYTKGQEDRISQGFVDNGVDVAQDITNVKTTSGSNTYGSWTKFHDGTMICRGEVTAPRIASSYLEVRWTYPQEFVGGSQSFGSITSVLSKPWYNDLNVRLTQGSNTSTLIRVGSSLAEFGVSDTFEVSLMAIGRWK